MHYGDIRANSFHEEGPDALTALNPYSYQEWCGVVDSYLRESRNHLFRQIYQLQEYLSAVIPGECWRDTVLFVCGSDGRLENTPLACQLSPLTMIIVGHDKAHSARIVSELKQVEVFLPAFRPLDLRVLEKIYSRDDRCFCLSGFDGDPRRPWPDMILDGVFLLGDAEVYEAARRRVFEEWEITSLRRALKKHLRQYIGITSSGERNGVCHFNIGTGEVFFDPARYVRGLKYGPIRALQVLITMRRLVDGYEADALLCTSTVQKMEKLYPQERDVVLAYKKALSIYHHQQHLRCGGESGYLRVAPRELGFISNAIAPFAGEQYSSLRKRDCRDND